MHKYKTRKPPPRLKTPMPDTTEEVLERLAEVMYRVLYPGYGSRLQDPTPTVQKIARALGDAGLRELIEQSNNAVDCLFDLYGAVDPHPPATPCSDSEIARQVLDEAGKACGDLSRALSALSPTTTKDKNDG